MVIKLIKYKDNDVWEVKILNSLEDMEEDVGNELGDTTEIVEKMKKQKKKYISYSHYTYNLTGETIYKFFVKIGDLSLILKEEK